MGIEACPWCGGATRMAAGYIHYIRCECGACGPNGDPTGAKWNEVAKIVREYRSGGYLTDEEIEKREAERDALQEEAGNDADV